ncbi:MAG: TolC family protein, partial [Candidatus Nanopelagicales bacterium]
LGERTDLRQQREQQRISRIDVDLARANSLPSLNLTAGYSLQGVGGDLFQRDNLGGAPMLISAGGWRDGLQSIADFDSPQPL